jgi:hypothetical protein
MSKRTTKSLSPDGDCGAVSVGHIFDDKVSNTAKALWPGIQKYYGELYDNDRLTRQADVVWRAETLSPSDELRAKLKALKI